MKYAWIDRHVTQYLLVALCDTLGVSISGYRAWKRGGRPGRQRLTDDQLLALIRAIHAQFKGAYGSPRMVDEICARGFKAFKARVERLMRENGHPGAAQAPLQGHHGLQARPAGGAEPAGKKFRTGSAEPGVDGGSDPHLDGRRLAVPGGGAGPVQPRDRWLVDPATHDGGYIEVFYNRRGRHSTLKGKSPIQFLQHWISTQHERNLAA